MVITNPKLMISGQCTAKANAKEAKANLAAKANEIGRAHV